MALSLGLDEPSLCGKCKAPLARSDQFCPACGADRHVEAQVQAQVQALEQTKLAQARKWILGIGFWYLISAGIFYLIVRRQPVTTELTQIVLWSHVGLFAIHVGLYLWARTAPLAAAVVALILFLSLHLTEAVLEPSSIYKGLIIKVIFVVVLVKAVMAGYEIHRLRNERA